MIFCLGKRGADVAPERFYEIGEKVLSEGPLAKA